MRYMTIAHHRNSYGNGYTIRVYGYGSMTYYGYSKRDAEKLYRKQHNLQRVKFEKIEV